MDPGAHLSETTKRSACKYIEELRVQVPGDSNGCISASHTVAKSAQTTKGSPRDKAPKPTCACTIRKKDFREDGGGKGG